MVQKHIPTLGVNGWVNTVEEKADYIIGAFITANTSDSELHRNQSVSLQYLLKQFANDLPSLEDVLRTTLQNKLVATFDESATATVNIEQSPDKPDQYSIKFMGVVLDEGKRYTVGQLVQFAGSRVLNIARINNG
jgi:hypothetical protein